MPNTEEFSELIRTGGLDFALTKPMDTQFLVSLTRSIGQDYQRCYLQRFYLLLRC